MRLMLAPRRAALLVLALATATIAGALASQHLFGLQPCPLCLQQRWPYYLGVPLAAATALAPAGLLRPGLVALALAFAASAALGGYHAGVEWGLWQGPADCAGAGPAAPASVSDFARSLEGVRVVSCTEAAWRFAGLSLAGWNAVVSVALVAIAARGALAKGPADA